MKRRLLRALAWMPAAFAGLGLFLATAALAAEPATHHVALTVLDGATPVVGVTVVARTDESRDKAVTGADGRVLLEVAGEVLRVEVDGWRGLDAKAVLPEAAGLVEATLHAPSGAGPALLELGLDDIVQPWSADSASGPGERAWRPSGSLPGSPLPEPLVDGFEPDDTRAECGSIPTDGTPQARDLDPGGDEDWICLDEISCGDVIRIETAPPAAGGSTVDTYLELYDPSDALVAGNDDGGSGFYSLIDYTAAESGPYAFKVRGYSSFSTGFYDVSVTVSPGGTPLIVQTSQTPTPTGILLEAEALTPAPLSYARTDEAEPVIDITGTGTDLILSDDDGETISIGFDFEFYGAVKTSVTVASNGYLTFGTDGTDLSNDCIPNATDPNDYVAAFWDDLDPGNSGSPARVLYEVQGAAPDRTLVVLWHRVPAFPNDGEHTFEVLLHETSNEIEVRYGLLTGDEDSDGGSATAGIENADATAGVQHSCNTAGVLVEGSSVRFAPEPEELIPYPQAQFYEMDEDTASLLDIGATGTEVYLSDDDGELIPIGFDFTFYGVTHTEVDVGSNGYLTFGIDRTDLSNDCIPSATDPDDYIAVFWDDLDPGNSGSPARVLYETQGAAPDRSLIVQWDRVPAYPNDGEHTFQAILHETSNAIELRYGLLTGDEDSDGGSATAGIENPDGTEGLQASCNTPGRLVEGARFTFTPMVSEPGFEWVETAGGAVLGDTDSLEWAESLGCEIQLTVATYDPAAGCEKVVVQVYDLCTGGGPDPTCGSVAECEALCAAEAENHGDYVSCMAHATQLLWKEGLIDRDERQEARRGAAHSDVGK